MKHEAGRRTPGLGIVVALLAGWIGAAYQVPEYTPKQLADADFVGKAIATEDATRLDLEARRNQASALQRASLDNDLRKVVMVLEFLHYVKANGYRPEDSGLNALAYMQRHRKISSQELPQLTKSPVAPGESTGAPAPATGDAPAISQGAPVDIEKLLVKGQTVVFDFFSRYCPPCRAVAPRLEKLDAMRDDLVVIRVDINRPGVEGIDWNSPVARQYNLRSIPHFVIYSPDGKKAAEGQEASAQVYRMLEEAGL